VTEGVAGIFGSGNAGLEVAPAVDVKVLHAKIAQLTLEVDFLAGARGTAGLLRAKR
jgi:transposase